jgi:polynucleotide 5'-triphosphatase
MSSNLSLVMDIKSLINPTPSSRLPTPPSSIPKTIRKRKRHDPIPAWAVREDTSRRVVVPHVQAQVAAPAQPPAQLQAQPQTQADWEPSITNDKPYDEITRLVCDFLWENVVNNEMLRQAIAEGQGTQVEVEAKWGQILDRVTKDRIAGIHESECVVRRGDLENTKFESTMSEEQHKRMNIFLNGCVVRAKSNAAVAPKASRAPLDYKHVRQTDSFYELNQVGFDLLAPTTKAILQSPSRQKVRITRDTKTGQVLEKIIKHRVINLEISSPQTEWDYRISVNLEINYPGPLDDLVESMERGRSYTRRKDRMCYSHLQAYRIDLTQVTNPEGEKNHELEIELDAAKLIGEAERIHHNAPSMYEEIVGGMVNNLRVLSRAIRQH